MSNAKHIYLVFNPLLNTGSSSISQAHEFYYRLKEKWLNGSYDEAFMYWGNLLVSETNAHDAEKVKRIINENKENGFYTHLYITDYKHFWVGKCEGVISHLEDRSKTLPFYDNKDVGLWFKVSDFELLSNDFSETLIYLRNLNAENDYNEKKFSSINPYLNGVKFPLIVEDSDNPIYFERTRVVGNNELTSFANEKSTFVVKPSTFKALPSQVKELIVEIEEKIGGVRLEKDEKAKFVFDGYTHIMNEVVNFFLGDLLRQELGHCLFYDKKKNELVENRSKDSVSLNEIHKELTLTHYVDFYENVSQFGNISVDHLKMKYSDVLSFFKGEILPLFVLVKKLQAREELDFAEVLKLRNQILGIGTPGILNSLTELINNQQKPYYAA